MEVSDLVKALRAAASVFRYRRIPQSAQPPHPYGPLGGILRLRQEKERPIWTVPFGSGVGRLVLHQHETAAAEVMDQLAQPHAGFGQARRSILQRHFGAVLGGDGGQLDGRHPPCGREHERFGLRLPLLYREQAGQHEGEKEARALPEQFPGLFPLEDPYTPFLTAVLRHMKTFSSSVFSLPAVTVLTAVK